MKKENLDEKAKIFLARVNERIDNGEFDKEFSLPFMTRKLLKVVVKNRMNKKIETGSTTVISNADLKLCLAEVKETAVETAKIFLNIGILERTEKGIEVGETGKKIFNL